MHFFIPIMRVLFPERNYLFSHVVLQAYALKFKKLLLVGEKIEFQYEKKIKFFLQVFYLIPM